MTTLFDGRERAEEYGFAHAEELRFLAARDGTAAVAAWASERMGGEGYAATLLDVLVGGGLGPVAARVRDDLARAGRKEAAAAEGVLERAVADAYARLHAGARVEAAEASSTVPTSSHHLHGFWGWEV